MIEIKVINLAKTDKRVVVTSALPYVNGIKHLGNLTGSLLPADVFHRYLNLFNVENIYICGTDEHGTPSEISALKEKMDVRAYCDKYHKIQEDIYRKWKLDFTYFGRTSSKENEKITQDIFMNIYKNGYIIEKEMTVPYCRYDKRYLPDRYIEGTCPYCGYEHAKGDQCEKCGHLLDPEELINPHCVLCGKSDIEFRKKKHLFLDFSKLQGKLEAWIKSNDHWSSNTRNFALGWIKDGLRPRCITRNLEWGIKVPLKGYDDLVFYVWFDAPIGYISMTKEWCKSNDELNKWWNSEDSLIIHFLGKDNIPFHTIFWPGTLMAAGKYNLPYYVAGYEYLNWNGNKFSTSLGNGLFTDEALKLFPVDYWRYYLISILPETKDSNFSWEDFQNKINGELIANYGNLFYRIVHFIKTRFNNEVPYAPLGKDEQEFLDNLKKKLEKLEITISSIKLRESLKLIMTISSDLNQYFQKKKPWETFKADREDCKRTLYFSTNVIRMITQLLKPIIPMASNRALEILNAQETSWKEFTDFNIKEGHKINEIEHLFNPIKDEDIIRAKNYKKSKGDDMTEGENKLNENVVRFNEFKKLDLRIGQVIKVEDHPNASKLYLLTVDFGSEKRRLVAGLKNYYTPDKLLNKKIVVIMNLEQKEIRGIKSEGMLLAADDGKNVAILTVSDNIELGAKIR